MADISKDALRKEITEILKDADLTTTSAKKVRQQIEEKLDIDLTARKKEFDALVMECFEAPKQESDGKGGKDAGKKRKHAEESEEEENSSEEEGRKDKRVSSSKASKGSKKASSDDASNDDDDDDASSDEEEGRKGAKKVKGGKEGKGNKAKNKGSDSDSDSGETRNKSRRAAAPAKKAAAGGKRGGGGYTQACTLSPELAAVVGQESMARHEVVRKVWSIIKERNLYDQKNKQFAICDDELLKVFGVKRFRTFGMMKYLKNHFVK